MLKQHVLMAEKYENFWGSVRGSRGEEGEVEFFAESEGKRLIPFSARKRYKKCKISPRIRHECPLLHFWGIF